MIDLSAYQNHHYYSGAGIVKRTLWYFMNHLFFTHSFFPFYGFKKIILVAFGAKIGKGFVIKPAVNIKYPWNLEVGDYVWLGEKVWIDNLDKVKIASNVCISQGAMVITGNHQFDAPTFDLIVKPVNIEDGVWIGAKAMVAPGVTCKSHSLLTMGSVATADLEPYAVYKGNPATKVKDRVFK